MPGSDSHQATPHPRRWLLLLAGLALVAVGVLAASLVQRSGGIRIEDIRFKAPDGATLSALLYTPPNATPQTPAPGVLAVHGYMNTRETQSPFAIEFARRGYVVLALDQRGHGYSGGAAMRDGFGGPEALAYLRSLPTVDPDQIGLSGHSMGGWTVLAAASAHPDGYRSIVLESSTTGPPFAPEGKPAWPRNLAVVFGEYDELSPFMWGTRRGVDIRSSPKLMALFSADQPVEPGRLYGDVAAGTGRVLYAPPATHPGVHLSSEAVADTLDWFSRTLAGGEPRPSADQIWWWKEIATGLALVGFLLFILGVFDLALALPMLSGLRAAPQPSNVPKANRLILLLAVSLIPAVSFVLIDYVSPPPIPVSAWAPQQVTNWFAVWALANSAVALGLGIVLARRASPRAGPLLPAILAALIPLVAGYAIVAIAGAAAQVDFRFWVVALRPLDARQAIAALFYLVPFGIFVGVAFRGLGGLMPAGRTAQYLTGIAAFAGGFLIVLLAEYGTLFATGSLPTFTPGLSVILAIQFAPVLIALAILAVFTWRRTNAFLPGAFLGAALVAWYATAGQATHFLPG
jgi:pimeloyl-ACP methyl ester carboxylesterase